MSRPEIKRKVRCALYTRKSSEEGLELAFTLFSSTTAASNRHRRTMLSPAFETRPGRSISPDWYRLGVSPK